VNIVRIKITLENVEPVVTRTLMVPLDIRLDRLHLTIQAAMGWHNTHLYEFTAGSTVWCVPHLSWSDGPLPAKKLTLLDVLEDTGAQTLHHLYDFGDCWEHRIRIGQMSDPEPGEFYPKLINASGRCPPEDVGGFPGYEYLLEALADPAHPDHEEMIEWHSDSFDPNAVPIGELKLEVLKLANKWKTRKTPK